MVDNNVDELDPVPRKLSYISLTGEDQSNGASKIAIMNIDPLKSTSPDNQPTIINDTIPIFSIRKIYKNLILLSLSFIILFTAYNGMVTLQSSLNTKNNVGVNSLIITYSFLIFSSIALTGVCMDLFGLKFTIIIGAIGYIFYIAANIKPLPVLMYISAALVGLAAAPLWTAKATYLNQIARYHSQHKNQSHEISVSLFFGIFFALFGTNTIWGNVISYFVLNQSSVAQKINCGIYFNPTSASPTNTTQSVDDTTRYILCGIFTGMGLLSMLLLFLTLDSIALTQKQTMKQLLKKSLEVLLSLKEWKHIDQFFLIPITMWTTIETAFLTAQFTRGFITCLIGIRYVGLVMVCNGIFQALSSYIFGRLVKYTGRIFVFSIAALINYAMIILMFLWEPKSSQMVLLFVIAGFWGIADAIWQTQVIATYTVLYSDTDPSALAKYRLWKAIGFVITYSYSSYVTIRTSLILLLIYLSIIYRFLTKDLFEYLHKLFVDRGYSFDENNQENSDINFSIDDAIVQHFSTLVTLHGQTLYKKSPIRQVTLESNTKVFFDQMGDNRILCMVDDSFDSIVVLKTINLFKALVQFHLGALPFTKSKTIGKLINRISASLQYFLNNITTNQALLFETCEYLYINPLIRQQCLDTCLAITNEVQNSLHTLPTFMMITCKDKIVYMHSSNDQNRLSNSDLFLLLLNNTSRPLRDEFKLQKNKSSKIMAHIYKTNLDTNNQNLSNSARGSMEDLHTLQTRRAVSLPTFPKLEITKTTETRRIEVIFVKTLSRPLAPFTMYTISLTDDISVLILIEWKSSLACSYLFELIHHLNLCQSQSRFSYTRLNNYIKSVENNGTIRRYFESKKNRPNILSIILNETQTIYKSLPKKPDIMDEDNHKSNQILGNLKKTNDYSVQVFHNLFFDIDEYALTTNTNDQQNDFSMNEDNLIESPLIHILRKKLTEHLGDWFSFIEIKSQRNITMSFCHDNFPGLVHFAFIDRLRGQICAPALYTNDYQHYAATNTKTDGIEQILEKKILAFELECLSALKRGCTSYTMTDEHFQYNYTLRLQESNGASMRLYKPFVEYQPPGILHFDFYKALANENYSSLMDKTSIACFELICVHLRIVSSSNVREQCEQLWPKLMELDE
ncbi:unnamed protein product [Adineta steineri]|uniref:Uncharacterized protein n=1 Tax=Adineta steineri TaxID=433720 RepID=A0A815IAB7_9BILA|nr:unnamed protein product [Adineta steineri]